MVRAFATVALAFTLGAAPAPTPAPSAAPDAPSLPEIGRVRSTAPACAAIRDLIIPSFTVTQRSDMRFTQTRVRLPQYAELAVDKVHKSDVIRDSALAKLDADATALLQDALVLEKMLADPRLKTSTDPQVVAQRNALAPLVAVQKARASQLQEFVMRERNAVAQNGMEDSGAFGGKLTPAAWKLDSPPVPPPIMNAPLGMPLLTGKDAMADKASVSEWGASMAAAVRAGENQAAKTFLPIAQSCR